MKKHAVCILAHKNWEQLDDLIEVLDSPLLDVYLHVDKRHRDDFDSYAKSNDFNRHSNVYLIDSQGVDWGGVFSVIG